MQRLLPGAYSTPTLSSPSSGSLNCCISEDAESYVEHCSSTLPGAFSTLTVPSPFPGALNLFIVKTHRILPRTLFPYVS
jgi:hypothetical protein